MPKYFNSNDKSEKLRQDNLSEFLDKLSFRVNSVGVWKNHRVNLANYTINDVEFIFYTKGEGKTKILQNEYYCHENDFMVLEPMQLYTSQNDESIETEYYFIHFDIYPLLQLKPFIELFNHSVTHIKNPQIILNIFNDINDEVKNKNPGYISKINALIKLMCIEVIRNHTTMDTQATIIQPISENTKEILVNNCIAYISHNLKSDCSVQTLSKNFNVSPNYLYKAFTSVLNESPSKYVTKVRMLRAKSLLLNDLFTIEEVAEAVGYPTLTHFSKAFKDNMNISPREFRKKNMI